MNSFSGELPGVVAVAEDLSDALGRFGCIENEDLGLKLTWDDSLRMGGMLGVDWVGE